jgi:hypothetical protein
VRTVLVFLAVHQQIIVCIWLKRISAEAYLGAIVQPILIGIRVQRVGSPGHFVTIV